MGYSKGRKLTEELVRDIAKSYNSLNEWRNKDPSSCRAAKKMGIFEELKNSKNIRRESTPQRMVQVVFDKIFKSKGDYNCRTVIPPFEIDLFYKDLNFGVEYNGYAFHFGRYKDDNRTLRKQQKELDNPHIWIFHIDEDRYYSYLEYVDFIKTYICNNLEKINEWCKTSISKEEIFEIDLSNIDEIVIFNWDEVIKLIDSYEKGSDFRKNNRSLYHTMIRKGRRDILEYIKNKTSKFYKDELNDDNKKLIDLVYNKYAEYSHFCNDKNLYRKCNDKCIVSEIKDKFMKRELETSGEFVSKMVNKYKTYGEFVKGHEDFYKAGRLNLRFDIKSKIYKKLLPENPTKWLSIVSEDEQFTYVITNFSTYNQFCKNTKVYGFMANRNKISKIKEWYNQKR